MKGNNKTKQKVPQNGGTRHFNQIKAPDSEDSLNAKMNNQKSIKFPPMGILKNSENFIYMKVHV